VAGARSQEGSNFNGIIQALQARSLQTAAIGSRHVAPGNNGQTWTEAWEYRAATWASNSAMRSFLFSRSEMRCFAFASSAPDQRQINARTFMPSVTHILTSYIIHIVCMLASYRHADTSYIVCRCAITQKMV